MLALQVFFKGQMEYAMVNLLSFLVGDFYNDGYFI